MYYVTSFDWIKYLIRFLIQYAICNVCIFFILIVCYHIIGYANSNRLTKLANILSYLIWTSVNKSDNPNFYHFLGFQDFWNPFITLVSSSETLIMTTIMTLYTILKVFSYSKFKNAVYFVDWFFIHHKMLIISLKYIK